MRSSGSEDVSNAIISYRQHRTMILPVSECVFLVGKKLGKIGQAKRVRRLRDFTVGRFADRRLSTECGQVNLSTVTGDGSRLVFRTLRGVILKMFLLIEIAHVCINLT